MMTPTNCRAQILRIWPVALVLLTQPAAAITLGQIDDFEDGTIQGWTGSSTTNLADVGPMGAGDNALHIVAGNRVVIFNEMQWKGNYTAAGVTQISMDVWHENAFDLELRLAISKGAFSGHGVIGGIGDTYVTSYSINVPNDAAWHKVTFGVTAADFAPTLANNNPSPNAAVALSDVTHLRILHSTTPGEFRGDAGGGVFRLDNIAAESAADADADFDGDDDVDGADFLIWQRGLGVGATPGMGDADGDGMVNADDLAVWKAQFSGAPASAASSAVPEPRALAAVGVVGLWSLVRLRACGNWNSKATARSRHIWRRFLANLTEQ